MPLYEYRCKICDEVTSAIVYSWSETQQPDCSHCGSADLRRLISKFSFRAGWGDSLNWAPSRETTSDLDENSPASIDSYMGRESPMQSGLTE